MAGFAHRFWGRCGVLGSLSASVFGRTAAADRHRQGLGDTARFSGLRRALIFSRRFDTGPDHQLISAAEEGTEPVDGIHSHDLGVVRHVADRIAVMHSGGS